MDGNTTGIELSIVSPIYGAQDSVENLYARVSAAAQQITESYEIVWVEDCSPDGSWENIQRIAKRDARVKAIKLSRNFGQQNAIAAGLHYAQGKRIAVIDCDLQDKPELIPVMWEAADSGADIVYTLRKNRKDGVLKRITSWIFYTLMGATSKGFLRPGIGTFSLITRQVRDAYLDVVDEHSLYVAVLHWLGFSSTVVEQEHAERDSGESGYSFSKLVYFAVNSLISQSNTFLYLSISGGFFLVLLAFIGIVYLIVQRLTGQISVSGYASIAILNLAVGGTIMLSLGILGIYIGRIFEQVKGRPLYLVQQEINVSDATDAERE